MIDATAQERSRRVWRQRPSNSLCHVIREIRAYRDGVDAAGLGPASRLALDRWALLPRVEAHGSAWEIIAREAFVAFGNGLFGLEVPMFGSWLDRDDVGFVAGSRVTHGLWSAKPVSAGPGSKTLGRKNPSASDAPDSPYRPTIPRRGGMGSLRQAADALSADTGGVYVLPRGLRCDRRVCDQVAQILGQLPRARSDRPSVWLVPVVYRVSVIQPLASRLLPRYAPIRLLARHGWLRARLSELLERLTLLGACRSATQGSRARGDCLGVGIRSSHDCDSWHRNRPVTSHSTLQ